jgi:hypothetical protein
MSKITTLDSLPESISAETEVVISGYYIEEGGARDEWILRRETDEVPVRTIHVEW